MSIFINGVVLPIQPTTLTERYIQIQTDQMSINGGMARNRIGQKAQAEMEFTIMQPSDFQTIVNYFTTGSGVTYLNDQSKYGTLSFSGLPTYSEDVYVQGASLYSPLKVTIRQV